MKFILYPVLFLFLFISCTKKDPCPPDEILGSLSLIPDSKSFLPYEAIQYLEYIAPPDTIITDTLVNDTIYYDTMIVKNYALLRSLQSLIHDQSRTVIENICFEGIERADKYYISEHETVDFFDLDTSRKFRIFGNLSINEDENARTSTLTDPVLYDELKLTVHRSNPSITGAVATIEFIANDRENRSRFSDTILAKINKIPLIANVVINDSVYTDVYEYRNRDSLYFYFKPFRGVVAFRDLSNRWWNLTRAF
jgi:hypothetical protein